MLPLFVSVETFFYATLHFFRLNVVFYVVTAMCPRSGLGLGSKKHLVGVGKRSCFDLKSLFHLPQTRLVIVSLKISSGVSLTNVETQS